ncbi:hypothetical protein ABG768_011493, partial [Culter alburnus]
MLDTLVRIYVYRKKVYIESWSEYTFTHKLTINLKFQTPSLFFSSNVMEWNTQDCGISKAEKNTSMLPLKIDQIK